MLTLVWRNKRLTRMATAEPETKGEAAQRLEPLPDEQRRFIEKSLVHCTCLTNPKTRLGMRLGIAAAGCFVVLELLHGGPGIFLILGVICGLAALMLGGAGIAEEV